MHRFPYSIDDPGDNRVYKPVLIEISVVDLYRPLSPVLKQGIKSEITRDIIHITIPVEITSNDTVPPPRRLRQPQFPGNIVQHALTVFKYGEGHPLAHDHQVGPRLVIKIGPDGGGDHTYLTQPR